MRFWLVIILLSFSFAVAAQDVTDSLVRFSELKFHSDFEKAAFSNYVSNQTDTLKLLLAIDPTITDVRATVYSRQYEMMLQTLIEENLASKRMNKKIKQTFTTIHRANLKKYKRIAYLPELFESGDYNCVSSTLLYSMLFECIKVPYTIKATNNHVYMIANPGPKSLVVETTNPKMEKNPELKKYKRLVVDNLVEFKVISNHEFESKSVDELFEEHFDESNQVGFDDLIGFQYYNRGVEYFRQDSYKVAYELFQKAYFFCPNKQVRQNLLHLLMKRLQECRYNEVADIDYLAQLARFPEFSSEIISHAFISVVEHHVANNKSSFCDSVFQQFIGKVEDENIKNVCSFDYFSYMSKHYAKTGKLEKYLQQAILLRPDCDETNELLATLFDNELRKINNYKQRLAKIEEFKKHYPLAKAHQLLYEHQLMAYLDEASEYLKYNYIEEGETYLQLFEKNVELPLESDNSVFIHTIEKTYRTLALFYYYHHNKPLANKTIKRGLKYAPESLLLQTSVY